MRDFAYSVLTHRFFRSISNTVKIRLASDVQTITVIAQGKGWSGVADFLKIIMNT